MRAATRALPLLRPGRSLAFVTLPAGLDPDDVVKQKGAAAMERMLASPESLLETLWRHERDAQPLASPEDKAGLKQRLIDRAEAIQQPDIKALYRRELLDRYSAFAFPRREFTPRRGGGAASRYPAPAPSDTRKLQAISNLARDHFTRAVLAGLARHPREIGRHAEALARLARAVPGTSTAIDRLFDLSEALEVGRERPIFAGEALAPPPDNTRFTFLVEGSDPDVAREDLAEAVALLVERPALEAAIAEATGRFESDPEDAFAEQQRLRERKLEIESRLGQMARKRAAGPAQESKNAEPDGDVREQETE
jgi:DNA primase